MSARDMVEDMLKDMSGGLGEVLGVKLTDVLRDPAEYSPETASLMDTISQTVVFPLATLVLVVLFFLELVRISVQVDGDRELFWKVGAMTLVKFALLRVIFEATPTVIKGILGALRLLAVETNLVVFVKTGPGGDTSAAGKFLDSVDQMDMLGQAFLVIVMLLAWLVNRGAVIFAMALVLVRFVKLFIFMGFAPVPMAFFATQDTRSFGIGFLRAFAAVVLQAFVLVLGFAIYQTLTSGWAAQAMSVTGDSGIGAALSIGGNFMLMGLVLITIVLGSGRVANELLGH